MKKLVLGILCLGFVGCGSNPDDKQTKRIDHTRSFTNSVKGAFANKSGDIIEFSAGQQVKLLMNHEYVIKAKKTGTNSFTTTIESPVGEGYNETFYINTSEDTSAISLNESFETRLLCSYEHAGKIDKVFWIPRPRDTKNLEWEVEKLREKSNDVNYVIHFKELNTEESLPTVKEFELALINRIIGESTRLAEKSKGFCDNDSSRPIYRKTDFTSPMLPLKSYSKDQIEFLQFEDYNMMKLRAYDQTQVTSEVFEKQ